MMTARRHIALLTAACLVSAISLSASAGEPAGGTKLTDVVLTDAGQLTGKTVDQHGQITVGHKVRIMHQKKVVATALSDKTGTFAVSNLRGGIHTVRTAYGDQHCRFWTVKAAPPKAAKRLVLVCDSEVVRAQCADEPFASAASSTNGMLLGSGGLIVGGVLGAVIGFNQALDRDPTSP